MIPMSKVYEITVTPTITAGAYSAGDVVGGLLTLDLTTSDAVRGGGLLRRVVVTDDAAQSAVFNLHLFATAPASIADNAAFAPAIADLQKRCAVVPIASADYATINGNVQAVVDDLTVDFYAPARVLYAYLVCTGTPTFAAVTDLHLRFTFMLE